MASLIGQIFCFVSRLFQIPYCLVLLSLMPLMLTAQTNGMTLAEVRTKVLLGNPSVDEQLRRIVAAEAVLKQARSAYFPTVTLKGNYGLIDVSLHPEVNPDLRFSDSYRQASTGLQTSWLIFDGFVRQAHVLAAKHTLNQQRDIADETRRLLLLSTTLAFREAQLANETIRIAQQNYTFNRELEHDAHKRFEAGILPESDVHNFSIRALLAEAVRLEAELNLSTACTVLAELMALAEAHLPQAMHPVAIDFRELDPIPSFNEELQYAFINRPDYKALKSGQQALEQKVRAAKGELLPKLSFVGQVNYSDQDGYATSSRHGNYDSFVGVAATWDLFTGGRKISTVEEAEAELAALQKQEECLKLSIRSTLRQRIDEAQTVQAVLERRKKIEALSASVRDSVTKSYQAGMVSITRLNEAQTDLVSACGNYATAYISYLLVLNRLDVETGRVLEN